MSALYQGIQSVKNLVRNIAVINWGAENFNTILSNTFTSTFSTALSVPSGSGYLKSIHATASNSYGIKITIDGIVYYDDSALSPTTVGNPLTIVFGELKYNTSLLIEHKMFGSGNGYITITYTD